MVAVFDVRLAAMVRRAFFISGYYMAKLRIYAQETGETDPEFINGFDWHVKPNSSGVCDVCGAPVRSKVKHRATTGKPYMWEKIVSVSFGQDWSVEPIY